MTKQEFLDALRQNLSDLPQEDVLGSIDYYAEMLDDRIEEGVSETQAVAQLGDPAQIAERIRMEMPLPTLVRARASKSRRLKWWEIALLILGAPLWLPLVLSAAVIVLSLYIALWSVLVSLYAVALFFAVAFVVFVGLSIQSIYFKDVLYDTFFLGGSALIYGALAILLFLASKALTKALCRGTASAARGCKKRIAGKVSSK